MPTYYTAMGKQIRSKFPARARVFRARSWEEAREKIQRLSDRTHQDYYVWDEKTMRSK